MEVYLSATKIINHKYPSLRQNRDLSLFSGMRPERNGRRLLSSQIHALIFTLTVILSILVSAFIVQFTYAQIDTTNTNGQLPFNNNRLSPPEVTVPTVLTSTYKDSIGNLHIVGQVQNNFTFSIQYVRMLVTLYNDNKEVVGMADAYTNVDQIRSGEIAGFDVTVTGPQQSISSYAISASYERSQIIKPEFIALSVGSYYLDANGHYHLTGKITNEGSLLRNLSKHLGSFSIQLKKLLIQSLATQHQLIYFQVIAHR